MSKNLFKFMNLLKNFSDYPFLINRLPQKGNLPQVKKHCTKPRPHGQQEFYNSSETWLEAVFGFRGVNAFVYGCLSRRQDEF